MKATIATRLEGGRSTASESIAGLTNKVTLPDTSPLGPALASLNGRLYLAWKGEGNGNLNIECSPDMGQSFGGKYMSTERSTEAPALCSHNGSLFVAWKGDRNNNLNVAHVTTQVNMVTGLTQKVTLGETSPRGPALASFQGKLFLGWKGDGNNRLNLMYSGDNGATFAHRFTSTQMSQEAPALTVHNDNLYIAWKGDGGDELNVAVVQMMEGNIINLTSKVALPDTSPECPSLASLRNRLFLAWKDDLDDNLNMESSADNGASFGDKYSSLETCSMAPVLTTQNGVLFVAWTSARNNQLNVARVSLSV